MLWKTMKFKIKKPKRVPADHVVKQLQSKRFHVKVQGNKKGYARSRAKKNFRKEIESERPVAVTPGRPHNGALEPLGIDPYFLG